MALLLTESEVAQVLCMAEGVRLVEESFRWYAEGRAKLAPRLVMNLDGSAGAFRIMAASVPDAGSFGVKTLTGVPGKRQQGETYFTMLLFDERTGALACVLAATYLTGVRTGAASAVAAKYLAREDARSVGLIGAGIQARAQILALREVRPIERVRIFDREERPASELAALLASRGMEASVAGSAREAVRGSDIVVTATTSAEPVISGEWLEPGMHVNAIGANGRAKRELDPRCFQLARLVVDFEEQVLDEAGDLIEALESGAVSRDRIEAELGAIVAGRKPGRRSPDEITLFKSVGVAIEDVAVAGWVYREAEKRGLGRRILLQD